MVQPPSTETWVQGGAIAPDLYLYQRDFTNNMTSLQILIGLGMVMATPHTLSKRDIPLTQVRLVVTNQPKNPSASGKFNVNLGWVTDVLSFNCQSVGGGWASCQMMKCVVSQWGSAVQCQQPFHCGAAKTMFDVIQKRETVDAFYKNIGGIYRCDMNIPAACVYSDSSFGGKPQCYYATGYYDAPWNDEISSLKVRPGCTLKADTDGGMRGRLKDFTGDVAWVGSDFNDVISAFTITCK